MQPVSEPVIAYTRPRSKLKLRTAMAHAQKKYGVPVLAQLGEILKLKFSPNRLSIKEYYSWQLCDPGLSVDQKKQFVGSKRAKKIWSTCNFDPAWKGLTNDKALFDATLAGLGFPTAQTLFFVKDGLDVHLACKAGNADRLGDFLRSTDAYPLFGKPTQSLQSLGACIINGYDQTDDALVVNHDRRIAVSDFLAEVGLYESSGYVIQKFLRPIEGLTADPLPALPTVRMLAVMDRSGVTVLRAAAKMPANGNVADNYWRQGNFVAGIDVESGTFTRMVTGIGADLKEIDVTGPDGASLVGKPVPHWAEAVALVKTATAYLEHYHMLGWDVGLSTDGPILIEANDTPDFILHQLVDNKGVWDQRLSEVLVDCEDVIRDVQKLKPNRWQKKARRFGAFLSGKGGPL